MSFIFSQIPFQSSQRRHVCFPLMLPPVCCSHVKGRKRSPGTHVGYFSRHPVPNYGTYAYHRNSDPFSAYWSDFFKKTKRVSLKRSDHSSAIAWSLSLFFFKLFPVSGKSPKQGGAKLTSLDAAARSGAHVSQARGRRWLASLRPFTSRDLVGYNDRKRRHYAKRR